MTDRQEQKRDRFRRIAATRTEKVLQRMRMLRRCANPAGYAWTGDEADVLIQSIEQELRSLREALRPEECSDTMPFAFPPKKEPPTLDFPKATP